MDKKHLIHSHTVGNAKTARVTKADERTGVNEPGLQGAKQHFSRRRGRSSRRRGRSPMRVDQHHCASGHVVAKDAAGKDKSGMDIILMTERVRHSNGKIVLESRHLISVTIRTTLVSGNSELHFYDPNMMNITIRHKYNVCICIRSENFVRQRITICICIRSIRSYPIHFHP
jgi:hypothetical protein